MSAHLPPHLAVLTRAAAGGRASGERGRAGPAAPEDPALREEARFSGVPVDAEGPTGRDATAGMARIWAELADFSRRRVERNLETVERLAACRNPADLAAACMDAWLTAAAQYAEEAAALARLGGIPPLGGRGGDPAKPGQDRHGERTRAGGRRP